MPVDWDQSMKELNAKAVPVIVEHKEDGSAVCTARFSSELMSDLINAALGEYVDCGAHNFIDGKPDMDALRSHILIVMIRLVLDRQVYQHCADRDGGRSAPI